MQAAGAVVLCVGVPVGTVVGLNQTVQRVGERFRGFCRVPVGVALLRTSAVGRAGDVGVCACHVLRVTESSVHVFVWSAAAEALERPTDAADAERLAAGVRAHDFRAGLAPVDAAAHAQWQRLTRHVDATALDRLAPAGGVVTSVPARLSRDDAQRAGLSDADWRRANAVFRGARDAAASSGQRAHFCRLPDIKAWAREHARTAADVTMCFVDQTWAVARLLRESQLEPSQLLAELELSFALFALAEDFEAMEHWKSLLLLLCASPGLADAHPQLVIGLADAVSAQLELVGKSGDSDSAAAMLLAPDSFLPAALTDLIDMLERHCDTASSAAAASGTVRDSDPHRLREHGERLREALQASLGWDPAIATLDDDPVIVDCGDGDDAAA